MKETLLRHWVRIAIATLLLVALWALKTRSFVSLPGIGPEKYDSFGKIPDQCLTVALALALALALAGLMRPALLLIGVSLGFFGSTLASYLQKIDELKLEAAADPDMREMVDMMLAETHTSAGFWILSITLAAIAILALFPVPTRMKPMPD